MASNMIKKDKFESEMQQIIEFIKSKGVVTRQEVVKKTGMSQSKVVYRLTSLCNSHELLSKSCNGVIYYAITQCKLDTVKPVIEKINNLLMDQGDMSINELHDILRDEHSRTLIEKSINNAPDYNYYICKSINDDKHIGDMTPIYIYLRDGKREQCLTLDKSKWLSEKRHGAEAKHRKKIEKSKPVTPLKNKVEKSEHIETRGHKRFEKYKDHSIKIKSNALDIISEVIALYRTSKNPNLFMYKLRHRIETMPEKYWL